MTDVKRFLVVGGQAQEIIDNIRKLKCAGITRGIEFTKRVGGIATQYRNNKIDAIAFDADPPGNAAIG